MTECAQGYVRYLEPGFSPFDPLALARRTEQVVCRDDSRKYTGFYCTGVYGGIATGYTCGCCLRCVFCWVDWSREYPEKYGTLELERFIFVTSGTPYIELVIPVVTVAGRLTFTINYLEENTDTLTMEKIKNRALEYLGIA